MGLVYLGCSQNCHSHTELEENETPNHSHQPSKVSSLLFLSAAILYISSISLSQFQTHTLQEVQGPLFSWDGVEKMASVFLVEKNQKSWNRNECTPKIRRSYDSNHHEATDLPPEHYYCWDYFLQSCNKYLKARKNPQRQTTLQHLGSHVLSHSGVVKQLGLSSSHHNCRVP